MPLPKPFPTPARAHETHARLPRLTRTLLRIAIPLLGMCLLTPAFADEISCELFKKYREGASAGYSARISFASGRIAALHVESFYAPVKEGGAHTCSFDISRQDAQASWESLGTLTSVSVIDDNQESRVTVRQTAQGHVIDTSRISSAYCGVRAQWPERIGIETGRKKCTVSPNP